MSEDSSLNIALKKLGKRKLKEADRDALLSAMAEARFDPVWANGWDPEWEMTGDDRAIIRFDSLTAQRLREMTQDITPLFKLPPPPKFWVERVVETRAVMQEIMKAPDQTKCLVLTGRAGSGKTALAYWIADQLRFVYPSPRLMIDLRGSEAEPPEADEALRHLLRALAPGMSPPENPVEMADRFDELTAKRPFVLILDHASGYEQVLPLIPRSPSLTIITSRAPLDIKDVPEVTVDGFSVMQVRDYVHQHLGQERLDDKEANTLFELTDGLPRAVALAVGWLQANDERKLNSLEAELRVRMEPPSPDDEAFDTFVPALPLDAMTETVLAIGAARTPAMLDKTRQISLMPASFDVRPAAVIWDVGIDRAAERLEALVNLGFLDPDRAGHRYRMPTELAAEMERGLIGMVRDEAETRYVEFFADVLHRAELDISNGDGVVGLSRIELEWPHIQACVNICLTRGDLAAVLVRAAPETLEARVNLNVWTEMWAQVRTYTADMGDVDGELEALAQMGRGLIELGDTTRALVCYQDQLEIARANERTTAEIDAWQDISRIHLALDDQPTAFQAVTKAVGLARGIGDDMREIDLLGDMERALDQLGQDDLADAAYERRADLMMLHGLGRPERERVERLDGGLVAAGLAGAGMLAADPAAALDEFADADPFDMLDEEDPADLLAEEIADIPDDLADLEMDPDPVGTLLGLPPEEVAEPAEDTSEPVPIDDMEADALSELDALLAQADALTLEEDADEEDDSLDLLDDLPPLEEMPRLDEAEDATSTDDLPPLDDIPPLPLDEDEEDILDIDALEPLDLEDEDEDELLELEDEDELDILDLEDDADDAELLELDDEDALELDEDDALLLDEEEVDEDAAFAEMLELGAATSPDLTPAAEEDPLARAGEMDDLTDMLKKILAEDDDEDQTAVQR